MITYDDYEKYSKKWNKTIKSNLSTVNYFYKGFNLHRCKDKQWGFTYYDIWNDHNPIFSKGRICGPSLYANDLKDARKQIDDLISTVTPKSDYGQMQDFDPNILKNMYG